MRIGLFLIDGFALMSYASFVEPLRAANLLSGKPFYDLVHVSLFGTRTVSSSGAEIRAQIAVGESVDFDMVCIFAGGIAPLDLMHNLIGSDLGFDLAQSVSDWFMHTEVRPAGGPQRASLAERYRINSPVLIAAIEAMENHIADPLDLDQVALLSGVGTRQLNRLFQDNLQQTTMSFYRDLRFGISRDLLRDSPLSMAQIAQVTGFSGASHFSQAFSARYGLSPNRFRQAAQDPGLSS